MFSKKDWKYIVLFAGAIVLLIVSELLTPKPIDWTRSYAKADKRPYGNYILFNSLDDIFGEHEVYVNQVTTYEAQQAGLWDNYRSILYINDNFEPSDLETEMLMDWVSEGNQVFIAARSFSGTFADTFNLEMSLQGYRQPFGGEEGVELENAGLNFVHPDLSTEEDFLYKRGTTNYYFDEYSDSITTVLGQDTDDYINYIQVKHGLGNFYLHSNPLVFTNYNLLLNNNYDYAARALSYLPEGPVIWDEYYKLGRAGAETPLRFILSQPALKWAWFLALGTLVGYVFFNMKRKQRIIPVLEPPNNSTLEFVETIGRLYYQNKDHHDLAKKKILYFKEYIRAHFFIAIYHWNQKEMELLAAKSGQPLERIEKLVNRIERILHASSISEADLIQLNTAIDRFKEDTSN